MQSMETVNSKRPTAACCCDERRLGRMGRARSSSKQVEATKAILSSRALDPMGQYNKVDARTKGTTCTHKQKEWLREVPVLSVGREQNKSVEKRGGQCDAKRVGSASARAARNAVDAYCYSVHESFRTKTEQGERQCL